MFINNFDPVAFEMFTLEIRWYSLAYIAGILLGWFIAKKKFIQNSEINKNFDDYIAYLIIFIIIGGRLGYVIIYNFDYYINNFFDIFKIWEGGMSFHGGVLGIIISSIIFSKKNDQEVFEYLDIIALISPIGIFFGRIANFINSELYGYETSVPWAVKFIQIDNLYRHPSQLYEAFFEGLILFLILIYLWKRYSNKTPGFISGIFLIIYSFFRFVIEFFRVPDEHLGYLIFNFSMGQLLSLIFILIGTFLIIKNEFKKT